MKLYNWDSEFLRVYGHGKIIVVAKSPEEARGKAREHFNKMYARHSDWVENNRKEFEEDIKCAPAKDDVLFIYGSA